MVSEDTDFSQRQQTLQKKTVEAFLCAYKVHNKANTCSLGNYFD